MDGERHVFPMSHSVFPYQQVINTPSSARFYYFVHMSMLCSKPIYKKVVAYRWWKNYILDVLWCISLAANHNCFCSKILWFLWHEYFMFKVNLHDCCCLQMLTDMYFKCFIVDFLCRTPYKVLSPKDFVILFTWVLCVQSQFTKRLSLTDGQRIKFYIFYDVFH